MNLMIVLAVIAAVILAAQYISQLRKNRNGNDFVSGGRVFFNWVLAIVLVICLVGIVIGSFHPHRQEAKPAQSDKTESVKYVSPSDDDDLGDVSVQFDKKVKIDDNGEAKVKFKISPQTKVTIQGHKNKGIVKVFKASKGTTPVKHSYTFDVAGTYDIIAERGGQKITKKLKVEANDNTTSSSSSSIDSSSSSASSRPVSSSSSSVTSASSSTRSSNNSNNSNAGNNTATSNNTGSSYRRRPTYNNAGGNTTGGSSNTTRPAESNTHRETPITEDHGYTTENP